MPDLNWDNEMLKTEFEQIVQFWLDLGVDGFRLDAVKEFYSGADDKNIAVLTWFNDMVKSKKEDAYLVGEAWNDYSVYAKYYQSGMDSFFDFTFADKDGIIADTVKGIKALLLTERVLSIRRSFTAATVILTLTHRFTPIMIWRGAQVIIPAITVKRRQSLEMQ